MAKKKETKPYRINLTFTEEQTQKLNDYIIKVAQKQGRVPHAIKTKLLRWAFNEWMTKYGNNYDIDWDSKE